LKPKLLDLFCCAGGAATGYARAGFEVVGVDLAHQKRYPFHFIRADVLALNMDWVRQFDAIHASPPCQGYTEMHAPGKKGAPKLIDPVREILQASGLPWIIENVEGARWAMRDPIVLCGTMFGLGTDGHELQRHRLFESNVPIGAPGPCRHSGGPVVGVYGGHARNRSTKHGGRAGPDKWTKGNKGAMAEAMGMTWASTTEMSEAIPPAYTEYLGRQLLSHVVPQDLRELLG
jgi:DNA (cytosine-5)-methyltransferase 1